MKELKKEYFKTGKIPKLWQFTGPGTATGNYGEVEWFLGSYTIKDFRLENGIAEILELVTDAPRGEVIKTKIEKYFPEASKIPGSGYILKLLPSYGGDWEQYYEIRMEWKK